MSFQKIVDPKTLETLTRVLNGHCGKHGMRSEQARTSVAASLLRFHEAGIRDEDELALALEDEDSPDQWRAMAS